MDFNIVNDYIQEFDKYEKLPGKKVQKTAISNLFLRINQNINHIKSSGTTFTNLRHLETLKEKIKQNITKFELIEIQQLGQSILNEINAIQPPIILKFGSQTLTLSYATLKQIPLLETWCKRGNISLDPKNNTLQVQLAHGFTKYISPRILSSIINYIEKGILPNENVHEPFVFGSHLLKCKRFYDAYADKYKDSITSLNAKNLAKEGIGVWTLNSLPPLDRFPNLVEVNLDGCEDLKSIPDLTKCPHLVRLSLNNCFALKDFLSLESFIERKGELIINCLPQGCTPIIVKDPLTTTEKNQIINALKKKLDEIVANFDQIVQQGESIERCLLSLSKTYDQPVERQKKINAIFGDKFVKELRSILKDPSLLGITFVDKQQIFAAQMWMKSVIATLQRKKLMNKLIGSDADRIFKMIQSYYVKKMASNNELSLVNEISYKNMLLMENEPIQKLGPNQYGTLLERLYSNTFIDVSNVIKAYKVKIDQGQSSIEEMNAAIKDVKEKNKQAIKETFERLWKSDETCHVMEALTVLLEKEKTHIFFEGTSGHLGDIATRYTSDVSILEGFYPRHHSIYVKSLLNSSGQIDQERIGVFVHETLHMLFNQILHESSSPVKSGSKEEVILDDALVEDRQIRKKMDYQSLDLYEKRVWHTLVTDLEKNHDYFPPAGFYGNDYQHKHTMRAEAIVRIMEQVASGTPIESVKKVAPNLFDFYYKFSKPLIEDYVNEAWPHKRGFMILTKEEQVAIEAMEAAKEEQKRKENLILQEKQSLLEENEIVNLTLPETATTDQKLDYYTTLIKYGFRHHIMSSFAVNLNIDELKQLQTILNSLRQNPEEMKKFLADPTSTDFYQKFLSRWRESDDDADRDLEWALNKYFIELLKFESMETIKDLETLKKYEAAVSTQQMSDDTKKYLLQLCKDADELLQSPGKT